jgi:hypothetical protein
VGNRFENDAMDVEIIFQNSEKCYMLLQGGVISTSELLPCKAMAEAIHAQPWLLGAFPYPLFFAVSQALAFHGVMLLLTKLFTMGL